MTTRAVEELDGGLGSCQPSEDLPTLAELCPGQPPEDRARGTHGGGGGWCWQAEAHVPILPLSHVPQLQRPGLGSHWTGFNGDPRF